MTMTRRGRSAAAALVLAVALAGCSDDDGQASTDERRAGTPPGGVAGGADCPVTAAEVNEVVGTTLTAVEGCTFLDRDPAGTGATLVEVATAGHDGTDEAVQSLRATLAAEFEVEDVADVGDAAFSFQRVGSEVVALVVFDGSSQVKITLGTAQPRADAVATLVRLYRLTRA
ncbi:MAG TPA: hypothetical protein VM264_12065 [Acidimicrobiales bacterium]|nr:hypothetical protein [Acidimicrobiales bacterium]